MNYIQEGTMKLFARVWLGRLACAFVVCCLSAVGLAGAGGADNGFTLIGTADLQGALDSFEVKVNNGGAREQVGGLARIATIFKNTRDERPGAVLALSVGDDLMGRYFRAFGAKAVFPLMAKAGYELLALGNHEFDRGPQELGAALKAVSFATLCSDLHTAKTPLEGLCASYVIRRLGGAVVGFFSLMTEDFALVTQADGIGLSGANHEVARRMAAFLREKGAQIIVAATHIGLDRDIALAKAVPGIDVIFGGHSHVATSEKLVVGKTLIVNGGEKGAAVLRLDVALDTTGQVDPEASRFQRIAVTSQVQPNDALASEIQAFRDALPAAVTLGSTGTAWNLDSAVLRRGGSGAVNLICDILRRRFNSDLVLFNAGCFRGDSLYPAGPVTDAMLRDIDAFESNAVVLELKGKHLKDILEHSAASYGKGGFLYPSGLRYAIDLAKPAQTLGTGPDGALRVVEAGARVVDIQIRDGEGGWQPIAAEKAYRVVVNDFLFDHDGDGYFWFKLYGANALNTYATYSSLVAAAFEQTPILSPAEPDGRIRVLPAAE